MLSVTSVRTVTLSLRQKIEPPLCEIELQTVPFKGIDTENQLDTDPQIGQIQCSRSERIQNTTTDCRAFNRYE